MRGLLSLEMLERCKNMFIEAFYRCDVNVYAKKIDSSKIRLGVNLYLSREAFKWENKFCFPVFFYDYDLLSVVIGSLSIQGFQVYIVGRNYFTFNFTLTERQGSSILNVQSRCSFALIAIGFEIYSRNAHV